MIVRVLEVLKANWNELFGLARGSGVLVDMGDDELEIIHWLTQGNKFCL
jgi:hypothetical protein